MADEPNGVVVSMKDMYDELRDLVSEVRTLTQELKESRKTDDDHERRIRALEQWRYALPASLVVALGAAVKTFWPA
ncbi:hypothetical protein [Nonomuraea sp. CA-141351]|uniref:hypothetical protein n=1 Tax=Nonomuraea sp. CA-141351 TaxID=3239996 RepID=UPI003D9348C6